MKQKKAALFAWRARAAAMARSSPSPGLRTEGFSVLDPCWTWAPCHSQTLGTTLVLWAPTLGRPRGSNTWTWNVSTENKMAVRLKERQPNDWRQMFPLRRPQEHVCRPPQGGGRWQKCLSGLQQPRKPPSSELCLVSNQGRRPAGWEPVCVGHWWGWRVPLPRHQQTRKPELFCCHGRDQRYVWRRQGFQGSTWTCEGCGFGPNAAAMETAPVH